MENQTKDSIDIILISSYKELEDNLPDLIPIYQKIFSEEPDFQFWSESTVKEIFTKYFNIGKIFIGLKNKEIIGFCVSIPLSQASILKSPAYSKIVNESNEIIRNEEDVPQILKVKYKVEIEKSTYIADFGVKREYRNNGIGSLLFERCINHSNGEDLLLRASMRKLNVINYYNKRGFILLDLYQYPIYNFIDQTKKEEEKGIFLKKGNF